MPDPEPISRRLVAVLALDIAGYSRLMSTDEDDTYRRLRLKMRDLVLSHATEASGRVVKTLGDGALIEFPGPLEALRYAAEVQRLNEAEEAREPPERRIRFRIGISLGEVIEEGGDLFGDGVNIAARLEGTAELGGIAVSEAVAKEAGGAGFSFLDLGLRALKNIPRPVRIYKVALAEEEHGIARPAGPTLVDGFGERSAIAILPFSMRGGDGSQDYLADGITEEVITLLAGWRGFPVISRGSSYVFKGRESAIRTIGQQLGARFLVEGALRTTTTRPGCTVQLHDAEAQEIVFAEQFDYAAEDVATMQDEIVRTIVGAIEPELLRRERERIAHAPQHQSTAYEAFQRGQWHHYRYTPEDNLKARAFFAHALAIDPNYAQAAAAFALALMHAAQAGWETDPAAARQQARQHAERAVHADTRDPQAHYALGVSYFHAKRREDAVRELSAAVKLHPSHAAAHANLANSYNYLNRPHEALQSSKLALRLSPHDPRRFMWLPGLAGACYLAGDYVGALSAAREALAANPGYLPGARYLVAALGQLGHADAARGALTLLRKLDGSADATEAHLRDYFVPPAVEHIMDGVRKAGFA